MYVGVRAFVCAWICVYERVQLCLRVCRAFVCASVCGIGVS